MEKQFSREQIDTEIKEALENNDQDLIRAEIQEYLDKEQNVPLNIAVTGECGSGKSSFVNAIRAIDNKHEEAAPTGTTETTMKVTPYPHPNYPNVTFWDLPGIDATNYPAAEYLKKVEFEKFDFFIIVSADRFRENDVKLAKEILWMQKELYFVRSKIDDNMRDEKRTQREFNEETTLTEIRNDCINGLQKPGFQSPQVFLVSSFDLKLYDFPLLVETLKLEIPELKKDAFLFAMPNISLDMIKEKKKNAFQAKVKYWATLSAAGEAVPVPGVSMSVDTALLVGVVTRYVFGFGLDIRSLKRTANYKDVPYEELRKVIMSPLAAVVTPQLLLVLLSQFSSKAILMAAEEGARLPGPVAVVLSFAFTYRSLQIFLNKLADDAERVFNRVHLNTTG